MSKKRASTTSITSKFAKIIHEDKLNNLNGVLHELCLSRAIYAFGIYKKHDANDKLEEITIIVRKSSQGKIIVCVYNIQKHNIFTKTSCKETGIKVQLKHLAENDYIINMALPHPKNSIDNIDEILAHSFIDMEDIEYRFSTEAIITRYITSAESDRRSDTSSSGSPRSKRGGR